MAHLPWTTTLRSPRDWLQCARSGHSDSEPSLGADPSLGMVHGVGVREQRTPDRSIQRGGALAPIPGACGETFVCMSNPFGKFVGGAQAKCATGRNNLCRSMSAVTLVRRSKTLMLPVNHTPAPFLPRSTGDMRREGTGCAGEAGRSAFMLWRHRRILQTAAGVLAERGERMGRQLTLFGSIARVGALAACCTVLAPC